MKKKILSIMLCTALSACLLVGCGGSSNDENAKTGVQANQEESVDSAEAGEESADTTETGEETATGEEDGKLNAYGITDAQQEGLVQSVKESIVAEYLEKYDIPESEFQLLPYDANDMANYDESGNYSGSDPYECARMWKIVDNVIGSANDMQIRFLTGINAGDGEMAVKSLVDEGFSLEDTLEKQNAKSDSYILDTSSDSYNFANAVYMGIADYLNGLEEEECVELLYHLFEISYNDGEGAQGNATMFDRVISENIQFE